MVPKRVGLICAAVCLFWFVGALALAFAGAQGPGGSSATIWIVFFNSHDCSQCESARALIEELKKSHHNIKVKSFDVEEQGNYSLFKKIEAIHGREKFAVPLVIVGEHILIGPDAIEKRLEHIVTGLARCGASLPYLGPKAEEKSKLPQQTRKSLALTDKNDCHCNQGGPPQITDEFRKIRSLLDGWF
jgi:glutaredoxin